VDQVGRCPSSPPSIHPVNISDWCGFRPLAGSTPRVSCFCGPVEGRPGVDRRLSACSVWDPTMRVSAVIPAARRSLLSRPVNVALHIPPVAPLLTPPPCRTAFPRRRRAPAPSATGAPPTPPPPPPHPPSGGGGDGSEADDGSDSGAERDSRGPIARIAGAVLFASDYLGRRARADPRFVFTLVAECGADASIIIMVNALARGRRFWKEIEFVACHLARGGEGGALSLVSLVSSLCIPSPITPSYQPRRPPPPTNHAHPSQIASLPRPSPSSATWLWFRSLPTLATAPPPHPGPPSAPSADGSDLCRPFPLTFSSRASAPDSALRVSSKRESLTPSSEPQWAMQARQP